MDKVQVLVRSHSDFAGGVDELTFRGTGTLEKTDYGYRLRYTAQNELDGSAVASEMRLETQQRRAVVITESKDGGYGLLLDPRRTTVTQIAGGDGGALTLHVETVVLLSHKKADSYIHIDVEFGEGEGKIPVDSIAKRAEAYKPKEKVTYKMIKEYIEAKYGFKVHTAYIAEVKRNLGLPMYDAPNAVEELKQPRKHPTPEKVEAIKDALRYFAVI